MISQNTWRIIIEGLFTTVTNVSFDNTAIENMIQKVRTEKERLVPNCSNCQAPCGRTEEYDMQKLWNDDEDIRSLKSLIPVSYTHLKKFYFFVFISHIYKRRTVFLQGVGAVSYTHLDVYKRQSFFLLSSKCTGSFVISH